MQNGVTRLVEHPGLVLLVSFALIANAVRVWRKGTITLGQLTED
jgi:hypothetical protein